MFYNEPEIVDPVPVDNPTKGVPSDHLGVVVTPITNAAHPPKRQKLEKIFRPMPDSSINKFGEEICNLSWDFLSPGLSSTELTELLQGKMTSMIDHHFPLKSINLTDSDQPWITDGLKKLKRIRRREFCRHGRSEKYYQLKTEFETKKKEAVKKYADKIIEEVREGTRSSSYKALRKLGVRSGDIKDDLFTIPSHIEESLSEEESAEKIADYFSNISQEFEPLSFENLPPNIKASFLNAKDDPNIPVLEPHEVYARMLKAKKPNSIIHGDIPMKIVKLFTPELALPAAIIYNKINSSFQYPRQWVIESQFPVAKTFPPTTEDDLRPISKTFFCSKVYESFLGEWIITYIKPYMDPGQYGIKGSSIVHYLIKFLHFIHSTLDLKQPHAVLAALIDLSKAFNRVSHMHVIQDLYDMHAPGWILAILFSYLSGRSMTMTYGKSTSTSRPLPGSTPQGALLGGLIFIVKYNGACLRPQIPRITLTLSHSLSVKYVDDHSCAVKINLKNCLDQDPCNRPRPLKYHERTQHILPRYSNFLQNMLDNLHSFTDDNLMKINVQKSKVMLFNTSRNFDFPPELLIPGSNDLLDVIESTKLLGIKLTADLRWSEHTSFLCTKAASKFWMLRRMKILNIDPTIIVDFYFKEVRSLCEMACQVFHSGLTKQQSMQIENIQKKSLKIILGPLYSNYEEACTLLEAEPLSDRRTTLCLNFVKKAVKGGLHSDIFIPASGLDKTRSANNLLKEYSCNTQRFYNSPLVYLSRVYNDAVRSVK